MTKTIASFFAGIGGFDFGFELEGFKTVFQSEIDPFCNAVLDRHWGDVLKDNDIRTLESSKIPEATIWCGGFPCQDVSVARAYRVRDGLNGKNSGLFYSFLDHIKSRLPSVIILENVEGLLNSHKGQDFLIVLEELTSLGYAVAWRVMNSRYFGAPQSRPRVIICASRIDPVLPLKALYELNSGTSRLSRREGFLTVDICTLSGARVPRVAYCLAATSGRHTGTDWSRTYISYPDRVRRLTPSECEGLQGFPVGWTADVENIRSNNYDIDTPRYKALGNAVAVPVMRWVAKRLMKALREANNRATDVPLETITSDFADFLDRSQRSLRLKDLACSEKSNHHSLKWQSGGYALGNICVDIKAPSAPANPIESPLIDVIDKVEPAPHYYLSPNAAAGILRRVKSQNRTLFPPMEEALKILAKNC